MSTPDKLIMNDGQDAENVIKANPSTTNESPPKSPSIPPEVSQEITVVSDKVNDNETQDTSDDSVTNLSTKAPPFQFNTFPPAVLQDIAQVLLSRYPEI